MRRDIYVSWVVLLVLCLTACTQSQDHHQHPQSFEPIEVEILVPHQVDIKREQIIQVRLKQGKRWIDDATDVQIEIWQKGQKEQGELLKAQHHKNGIYRVSKTFANNGIYFIQAHVTARGMHAMPIKQVIIGKVTEQEQESEQKEQHTPDSSTQHGHHH